MKDDNRKSILEMARGAFLERAESIFLIRISERGISFIEADGGMWKLSARETIKKFLEERLQQEVSEGSVVIAL